MAYDKHTWTCDEPITVERLNHIEDGIANAGGDCDCGYECTETVTPLTEESVTTVAQGGYNFGQLSYSQLIDTDSITVTFDGVEYECPRTAGEGGYYYGGISQGAPDFSEYPFVIASGASGIGATNQLATETAGTHSIKIEAKEAVATTTPCFDLARGYSCNEYTETVIDESVTTVGGKEGSTADLSFLIPQGTTGFTITFDGVIYNPTQNEDGTYGAYEDDFSEYPFTLRLESYGARLYTENPGTYSIKIEVSASTITTTPCFKKAVQSIATSPLVVKASCAPSEGTVSAPSRLDASPSEIQDAMKTRGVVVEDPYGNLYSVLYATGDAVTIISSEYIPNATPHTVLEPYMYTYQNVLRYPQDTEA